LSIVSGIIEVECRLALKLTLVCGIVFDLGDISCMFVLIFSWMGFQPKAAGDSEATAGQEICATECKGG